MLLPHLRATALRSMPAWARAAAQGCDGAFADAVADSGDAGALGLAGAAADPGALRPLGPSVTSRCSPSANGLRVSTIRADAGHPY